ncbi:AMIN domain-containing protein [Dolichospermum sp. ST_sed1]|nr:AMIN domain-containing protein [Dolichospermum sp. ST_sed1]MDD1423263.1 AMIN domain-containing protein [Dolichospermum sp. ST_sed9]MDD1430965.1 AMIN domain-containing protein [Dolichospermum sp. ST_sed6]MDD1435089.1 AMIN domain-containing protein [Dolichospermum sp. ST_sed10]MDD1438788.1 AMIN domain-containing protein [Dolichospermum sp. ST_sed3]MDD1444691.1 AMIN domain-containing protein [Dolichospermum sp. ST_sed8]MDD1454348.1 AMIN domain-containing protein [Dolichospermum sp. ST_sed7]M
MKNRTNQILPSIGVSLFGLITLTPNISIAQTVAQLNGWEFNPKAQQLEINLSATATPKYFYLPQPPRLVLDLPNTKLGKVLTQKEYSGAIQRIRISQLNENITRIVLDLAPETQFQPNQVQLQPLSRQKPTRWVLKPHISYSPANSLLLTPSTTLPPSTNLTTNSQQPLITVPPLNSQNPPPIINSPLPSAMLTTPLGNNNISPSNPKEIPIIEFGQPLPSQKF